MGIIGVESYEFFSGRVRLSSVFSIIRQSTVIHRDGRLKFTQNSTMISPDLLLNQSSVSVLSSDMQLCRESDTQARTNCISSPWHTECGSMEVVSSWSGVPGGCGA